MTITDAEILALKPKSKPYKVYIAKCVYLLVMPNGSKYWRFRYHLNGKECGYALGVYPEVSIEAARAARDAARALIRQGINPSMAKREAKANAAAAQGVTRTVFRLGLSKSGALTIETQTNALTLTCSQTQALAAFLANNNGNEKETQECR